MRYWTLAAILALAFLVQSVLARYLAIGGITPDFVLVLVVIFGLMFGWEVGLASGILGGLLLDLSAARYIGMHLLALGSVGLMAGLVEEKVFKDNFLLAPAGTLIGSVISQILIMICLWFFGWEIPLPGAFRATVVPAALYNSILALLLYGQIYKYYLYIRPDPRGTIVVRRH